MSKMRFIMEKTGTAKYISHLDLMRTVRRAFTRAGIELRHSEGFNPHPLMSFALPLSVGQESVCEVLDVDVLGSLPANPLKAMNAVLPDGLHFSEVYESLVKAAKIKWLRIEGVLDFDAGVPSIEALAEVFRAEELIIHKKTKRGEGEFDIKNGIAEISFSEYNDKKIKINATVSAQEPTINPNALAEVLGNAGLRPDFAEFRRVEILNEHFEVFR